MNNKLFTYARKTTILATLAVSLYALYQHQVDLATYTILSAIFIQGMGRDI